MLGKRSSQGQSQGGKRQASRGQPRSASATAVLMTDLALKKWKQWRDQDMCEAIHAVQHEQLNISEAAKVYSVPRQTLGKYLEKFPIGHNLVPNRT